MEAKDLRIFLTVAEELHFGRASERLHMAQPPVSRTIRALEEELGVKLFQRDTRNVELTSAGSALVEPAQEILEGFRRASLVVKAAEKGETGIVRIAFAGASTQIFLGKLALASWSALPGIVLELLSQNFAQPAMARVLNHEVDIALGRWDHIPAGVLTRTVVTEKLVLAVPKSHPLASIKVARIKEFEFENYVTLAQQPGSVLGDRFWKVCHQAGFEPSVVQVAPDTWTKISLVGAGVGCALTLSTVAETSNDPNVKFIEIEDAYEPVEMRMAWLENSDNQALQRVLEITHLNFSSVE